MRDLRSLEKLMIDFRAGCERGDHDDTECKRAQHRKFQTCWDHRASTKYFRAVCPDVRELYELHEIAGALSLSKGKDLPTGTACDES